MDTRAALQPMMAPELQPMMVPELVVVVEATPLEQAVLQILLLVLTTANKMA